MTKIKRTHRIALLDVEHRALEVRRLSQLCRDVGNEAVGARFDQVTKNVMIILVNFASKSYNITRGQWPYRSAVQGANKYDTLTCLSNYHSHELIKRRSQDKNP